MLQDKMGEKVILSLDWSKVFLTTGGPKIQKILYVIFNTTFQYFMKNKHQGKKKTLVICRSTRKLAQT